MRLVQQIMLFHQWAQYGCLSAKLKKNFKRPVLLIQKFIKKWFYCKIIQLWLWYALLFSNLGSCQTMCINLFTKRIADFLVHNEPKWELMGMVVRITLLWFLWGFACLFFNNEFIFLVGWFCYLPPHLTSRRWVCLSTSHILEVYRHYGETAGRSPDFAGLSKPRWLHTPSCGPKWSLCCSKNMCKNTQGVSICHLIG